MLWQDLTGTYLTTCILHQDLTGTYWTVYMLSQAWLEPIKIIKKAHPYRSQCKSTICPSPYHKGIQGEQIYTSTLTSALHEVVNFKPRLIYQWGRTPSTYWIRGWVGIGASPNILERTKHSCPCQELHPKSSGHSLGAAMTMLSWFCVN